MKQKVFIDCGFHHGEALKAFIKALNIDRHWLVYCFEANPACNIYLRILTQFFREDPFTTLSVKNFTVFDKAVWVRDGEANFLQENHFVSESGSPTDGESTIDGWCSRMAELVPADTMIPGYWQQPIPVRTIDFSKWITQFENSITDFEVHCKMDIEGAEFKVLRKILHDGNAGIFKNLWIEFHPDSVPGESLHSKKVLINELQRFTNVCEWD